MKKSITLAELMIAITLLAVVILAAGAFDIASKGFLRSSDRKAKVINELSYVTDHLQRIILLATGDANDPGIIASGTNLTLRLDISPVTFLPRNTPTYADDAWVRYRISGDEIQFCSNFNNGAGSCSVTWETITNRFVNPGSFGFNLTADGVIEVSNLSLRYDPSAAVEFRNNPEITMTDTGGSTTLSFTSLCHTW